MIKKERAVAKEANENYSPNCPIMKVHYKIKFCNRQSKFNTRYIC